MTFEKLNLTVGEIKKIKDYEELQKAVDGFIESASNINPNIEESQKVCSNAGISIKIMLKAFSNGLIVGPYDEKHLDIIVGLFPNDLIRKGGAKKFWNIFSFHCACYNSEIKKASAPRVYLEAVFNILSLIDNYITMEGDCLKVADLNSGKIVSLKARGVKTKF